MIDPGEPEVPWQPDEPEQQVRSASGPGAAIGAVFALLFVIRFANRHARPWFRGDAGWFLLVAGLSFAYHVASDVRRGRSNVGRYGNNPRYDYVRAADPVGFWAVIAVKGACAAAVAVFALGLLLGVWSY